MAMVGRPIDIIMFNYFYNRMRTCTCTIVITHMLPCIVAMIIGKGILQVQYNHDLVLPVIMWN